MRLLKKDQFVEHDGAKIFYAPRNLGLIRKMNSIGETSDWIGIIEVLVTGWEGVKDEDGSDVKFTKANIALMEPNDAKAIVDLINKAYGFEVEKEKN